MTEIQKLTESITNSLENITKALKVINEHKQKTEHKPSKTHKYKVGDVVYGECEDNDGRSFNSFASISEVSEVSENRYEKTYIKDVENLDVNAVDYFLGAFKKWRPKDIKPDDLIVCYDDTKRIMITAYSELEKVPGTFKYMPYFGQDISHLVKCKESCEYFDKSLDKN